MVREYEMSQEDLDILLEASRPVPYMIIGGMAPPSPQENARRAWKALGRKMGFQYMTARPVPGKNDLFFLAEPNEVRTNDD